MEEMKVIKAFNIINSKSLKEKTPDVEFFGNPDQFSLLYKASSKNEGWMKSTKVMDIIGEGCIVQVSTQQRNPDGSYSLAEAVCFVPNIMLHEEFDEDNNLVERRLISYHDDDAENL